MKFRLKYMLITNFGRKYWTLLDGDNYALFFDSPSDAMDHVCGILAKLRAI